MSNVADEAIPRSASRLRLFVFAVMAAIVLVLVAAGLNLQLAHAHIEYHLRGMPYEEPIAAGSALLLLVALLRLAQMLGQVAAGELFTVKVIRHFRAFALWLLLMALFEFVAPIMAGVGGARAGQPHVVRINIDLRDLLMVGLTLLLFLLARLLERARRLDEEVREFV
jgi:hypothetical protein